LHAVDVGNLLMNTGTNIFANDKIVALDFTPEMDEVFAAAA